MPAACGEAGAVGGGAETTPMRRSRSHYARLAPTV